MGKMEKPKVPIPRESIRAVEEALSSVGAPTTIDEQIEKHMNDGRPDLAQILIRAKAKKARDPENPQMELNV